MVSAVFQIHVWSEIFQEWCFRSAWDSVETAIDEQQFLEYLVGLPTCITTLRIFP
jgi:hypothetical protein